MTRKHITEAINSVINNALRFNKNLGRRERQTRKGIYEDEATQRNTAHLKNVQNGSSKVSRCASNTCPEQIQIRVK
ncbi:hypothetical protein NDU88_002882 [Pleurodeles waltl]|uniref:Uncharacterized protein n=1 Tax=Pleurodeles waltl TaxID=8319 RepID=A0AAV7RCQ3_PLEWA|nr:hypothetical protein NDU88_002882 [Pleurodeles waltl]